MSTVVESTITFPYQRSLGPVLGAFLTALTEERLIGIRSGDRVLCPPLEWDPETGAELAHDFVDVGPAGTVESWCWVAEPSEQHPLDHPFAFATVRLDGADTGLIHVVDAGSADAMSVGLRVAPRWRAERRGHLTDLEAFVPGEAPVPGGGGGADEPVTMMGYNASISYTTPVPDNVVRSEAAAAEGRFLGLRCPICGRTYTGGRGYCPVDSIALTAEHEVDLPQKGVLTSFTIVTPVQYPGQTETEPFARVHVLLEGTDVVLSYQALVDTPNEAIRTGLRLAPVWASAAELGDGAGDTREAGLIGWIPTGEPDATDPDLVNRLC
ncbi:MAG: OB-fold domain-containing protein [Acidimicrobiales bacterium]|nr:OB-fold domain-containing protein [Acidimicrobiales bacterium]